MYIFLVIQFKNLSFLLDSNVLSISSMAVENLKRAHLEFGASVISPTISELRGKLVGREEGSPAVV